MFTLQFQIIWGGGLNKSECVCVSVRGGGPTDNLIPINGEVQKKGGEGSEKCSRSKVATRYH